jgi:hypothetical protein
MGREDMCTKFQLEDHKVKDYLGEQGVHGMLLHNFKDTVQP